jgi:hypothetical protein
MSKKRRDGKANMPAHHQPDAGKQGRDELEHGTFHEFNQKHGTIGGFDTGEDMEEGEHEGDAAENERHC